MRIHGYILHVAFPFCLSIRPHALLAVLLCINTGDQLWSIFLLIHVHCYYSARVGVESIVINPSVSLSVCVSVCLSASISLEPLNRSARNFVCGIPLAVARFSSGGVAVRYVLPVLWMTSCLAVMCATPKRGGCTMQRLPWAAYRYRGRVWCLWMLVWPGIVSYCG